MLEYNRYVSWETDLVYRDSQQKLEARANGKSMEFEQLKYLQKILKELKQTVGRSHNPDGDQVLSQDELTSVYRNIFWINKYFFEEDSEFNVDTYARWTNNCIEEMPYKSD